MSKSDFVKAIAYLNRFSDLPLDTRTKAMRVISNMVALGMPIDTAIIQTGKILFLEND